MQLATAIKRPEIDAMENFISAREFKELDQFKGVIIRLDDVIIGGGWKKHKPEFMVRDFQPNLAICGSTESTVSMNIERGVLIFNSQYKVHGELPTKDNTHIYRTAAPPLPNHIKGLAARHPKPTQVLFEVEKWERMQEVPRAPLEDPALLTHLVGNLYGVLATWDLTKAEKAALQKYLAQ
jgi:hypothetical protein